MFDFETTYRFIYEPNEYPRIIQGVNIDSRATIPAIKNQIGAVIKTYVDVEVDKVKGHPSILFFRIETKEGVLAGYMSLKVKGDAANATLYQYLLRPNFQQFNTEISVELVNFIVQNKWKQFFL